MSMNCWTIIKDLLTLAVAGSAAFVGLRTYLKNSDTRRAEFIWDLHQGFFVAETYREIRGVLDSGDHMEITALIAKEDETFTDFLNYFELVGFLVKRKSLPLEDARALLGYYLNLLKNNGTIHAYIWDNSKGFEQLRSLLVKLETTPEEQE
jgi:hypothetical protein